MGANIELLRAPPFAKENERDKTPSTLMSMVHLLGKSGVHGTGAEENLYL